MVQDTHMLMSTGAWRTRGTDPEMVVIESELHMVAWELRKAWRAQVVSPKGHQIKKELTSLSGWFQLSVWKGFLTVQTTL